jgi:hypothetical protein
MTAQKLVTANDYDGSINENQAAKDELASILPSLSPRSLLRYFAKAGDSIGSLFGSCAYAAVSSTPDAALAFKLDAACRQSTMSHSVRQSCAAVADRALSRSAQADPDRIPALLREAERIYGADAVQAVMSRPFDTQLIARLLAKDDPSLAPGLKSYFDSLPAKLRGKGSMDRKRILAKAKGAPAPSLGVATQLSVPTSSARAPASASEPETQPAPEMLQPELSAASASSLFDIVSKRYDKVRDRVAKAGYVLPYNRYSVSK